MDNPITLYFRRYLFLLLLLLPATALAADYPPVVGVALSKASALAGKKEYAKAIAVLNKALTNPEARHKELYLLLGNCAMLQGNAAKAATAYEKGTTLDGSDPQLWLNLAKSRYELKRFAGAATAFRSAWEKSPAEKRSPAVLYYSAGSWLSAGKSDKALAAFDTLFASYPGKIKELWREQYVHALIGAGKTEKALPLIRQIIAKSSGAKKMQWQEILLAQYVELKQFGKATTLARSLTEQAPGDAKWWLALTHIQLAAGNQKDALAALIACSWLKPLDARQQKLLADLYFQNDVPGKAAPLYAQQLKQKYQRRTLQTLVMALHRQDRDDKALALLKQYKKETAKSPLLLQLEGQILYGQRSYAGASRSYATAAGLKGNHEGACWLMAGYSALEADKTATARRYLRRAAKFKKQKKSALRVLAVLNRRGES